MKLFGTNGVRGITNDDMTPELALRLGKAIGTHFKGNIAIATDTRTGNEMLKNAVISGLISTGNNVFDAKIVPTPALQYYVKKMDEIDAGVMITASHNPPQFDGIKVIDGDGTELARESEEKIERIYFKNEFKIASWNEIGKVYDIEITDFYIEGVLSQINGEAIKRRNYKVVVDCGNGAGCFTMPYLIGEVSQVISLNSHPDGRFPARLPEPAEENIGDLMAIVKSINADVGISYDGDADRAIFVDENGVYVPGDKTLAAIAGYMVEKRKGTIVTPVSTSSCVEDYVKAKGGNVVYTKVGAPIVARKMMEIGAVFGGEENGGLIFPKHQYCRDAGMASMAMLELMAKSGRSLSEIINDIPDYKVVKTKIECDDKEKVMEKIKKMVENAGYTADYTDGIKIFFDDGWVLVRPSGTEPIIRIYSQAKDKKIAEKRAEEYKKIIIKGK